MHTVSGHIRRVDSTHVNRFRQFCTVTVGCNKHAIYLHEPLLGLTNFETLRIMTTWVLFCQVLSLLVADHSEG